jgi:hypothetical protein
LSARTGEELGALRAAAGFEAALRQASEEHKLADYYRDCVRPLFNMPESQWPRCCGRGCEPCAEQLIDVARRVVVLLSACE